MDIERELELIAMEEDLDLQPAIEHVRRLDAQISERTAALDHLRNAVPDLEEAVSMELADDAPAKHSVALRRVQAEITDAEGGLQLLRRARDKAQQRVAAQHALRASRVEARLRPLFVQTITEIDGLFERADVLNQTLGKLHCASQRHLGAVHGLSQGYCFPSIRHWRARVRGFVKRDAEPVV